LAILILTLNRVIYGAVRDQIPPLPEKSSVSEPVYQQISYADRKARRIPSADRLGFLGMVCQSGMHYEQAAQCYRLAVSKRNSRWIWNYYLGYLDKEMGNTGEAVKNFTEVLKKDSLNNMALYYIGEGYQDMGLNDKAEAIFKRIADRPDNSISPSSLTRKDYFTLRTYAMFQLSRIFLGTRRTDLAEQTLKDIIRNQSSFGPAYRLLGNTYKTKGDEALSSHFITRANELKNLTTPVDTLADRLSRISRSDLYLLKQIDEAEKNAYPVWAIELINNAIHYNPDNKYLISKAIKIFLLLDLHKYALPYMEKHMRYFGDDISEMKMVADLFMKKGLYSQSEKYFTLAVELQPDDIDSKLSIILCQGYVGLRKKALESLNELHQNNPDDLKVLTNGVYILLLLEEKELAKTYLNKLRSLYPENPKGRQLAGIISEQDGNTERALLLYEMSFKDDPEDLTTIHHLCDLLVKLNKWEKAIGYYSAALEYHPNEPYLQESLAMILVMCPDTRLRNINLGREYAERAFINKSSPGSTRISAGQALAEAYAMLGDRKNAYACINATIDLAKNQKASPELITSLQTKLELYSR